MIITDLHPVLLSSGFKRTSQAFTLPLIIHGVPGCGKSTFIKSLLSNADVQARTIGPPYGRSLTTAGVTTYQPHEHLTCSIRILDEYQHLPEAPTAFNVLVGDPFQGVQQLNPHYFKELSHRVPRPITSFLTSRDYQISGELPGKLVTSSPFSCPAELFLESDCILHLGPVSRDLTQQHSLATKCPKEVVGLEFDKVALIYHSSELQNRSDFYIACTRAKQQLFLLSDQFHELQTAT